jgi:hypothetical protein
MAETWGLWVALRGRDRQSVAHGTLGTVCRCSSRIVRYDSRVLITHVTWREHRSPEPRPSAVEEVLRQVDLLAIYRSRYQGGLAWPCVQHELSVPDRSKPSTSGYVETLFVRVERKSGTPTNSFGFLVACGRTTASLRPAARRDGSSRTVRGFAALSSGYACSDELVWPNPAVCGD